MSCQRIAKKQGKQTKINELKLDICFVHARMIFLYVSRTISNSAIPVPIKTIQVNKKKNKWIYADGESVTDAEYDLDKALLALQLVGSRCKSPNT